jgi:hypothetical protein
MTTEAAWRQVGKEGKEKGTGVFGLLKKERVWAKTPVF